MQQMFWVPRCARWVALCSAAIGLLWAGGVHAQTAPTPLIHKPDVESVDWREANEAVGQFLRGHIDVLRWEQQHMPAPAPSVADTPTDAPLTLAQALAWARQGQPQLVARANASALERQHLQRQTHAAALALERAWVQAVVAQQAWHLQHDVLEATEAGAELARRMAQVGNWSRAQYLQHDLLHQQAIGAHALAQHQAHSAVLALWQQLHQPGLTPEALAAQLPRRLPDLPTWPHDQDPATLFTMAQAQHPDWARLHFQAQQARRGLSDSQQQQWQDTLASLSQTDLLAGPAQWPPRMSLPHSTEQTLHTLAQEAQLARTLAASVQRVWHRWSTAHSLATHTLAQVQRHHTELEEAALQQYNGMFTTTWGLLASTRTRIESVAATVQAQQQAWMAHIALRAVVAGLPDDTASLNAAAPTASATSKPH